MPRSLRLLTWNIGYLTDADNPAAIPLQAAAIAYADPDIVFDRDLDLKYDRALSVLGVDPCHLVNYAGRA